jgi:predicted lactoylglutathione lyase
MSEHHAFTPATLALPTADRQRAHRFYGRGLGFATPGEPADDGVPEPLRVVVNDQLWLMLIPTGGFGWVTAGAEVAEAGTVECQIGVTTPDAAGVDAVMETARAAGATILSEAGQQDWGHCGVFADPDGHQWMVLAEPSP